MPSDYQKKKLAKKKEAAKQKGGKKATTNTAEENGVSNGKASNGLDSINGSKAGSSEPTTYEGKNNPNNCTVLFRGSFLMIIPA